MIGRDAADIMNKRNLREIKIEKEVNSQVECIVHFGFKNGIFKFGS